MCEVMRTQTVPSSSSLNKTWITLPMKDSAVDLGGAFFGGLVSVHVQRHQLPRHSAAAVWGGLLLCICVYFTVKFCVCGPFRACDVSELWAFWGFHSFSVFFCEREWEAKSQTAPSFFFPFLFQTKEELET